MSPGRAERFTRATRQAALAILVSVAAVGCSPAGDASLARATSTTPSGVPADGARPTTADPSLLPGMPSPMDPGDIYAADRPNALSAAVRNDLNVVYVPNNGSNTVSIIDPHRFTVIRTIAVPESPEHVVPSWDLRTLWVNSDQGNALTPINPFTGVAGRPVPVNDPYNLYFTPDGKYAIVMAEAAHQIVFRDPYTLAVRKIVHVPCDGVNHADFSGDGRYFIASCEFSGDLLKVDTERQEIVAELHLPAEHAMPQDVKISPDGRMWYVADMQNSGVWMLDGDSFRTPTLLRTGFGAHGLYVSRDSKTLYISNRGEGSISLLDLTTRALVGKWWIPGGGSPDMGGLSADGTVLWLSGRYHGVVYAIDTRDGHLIAKIRVGSQPHGLCVWPQPGRYSIGHTGILR